MHVTWVLCLKLLCIRIGSSDMSPGAGGVPGAALEVHERRADGQPATSMSPKALRNVRDACHQGDWPETVVRPYWVLAAPCLPPPASAGAARAPAAERQGRPDGAAAGLPACLLLACCACLCLQVSCDPAIVDVRTAVLTIGSSMKAASVAVGC